MTGNAGKCSSSILQSFIPRAKTEIEFAWVLKNDCGIWNNIDLYETVFANPTVGLWQSVPIEWKYKEQVYRSEMKRVQYSIVELAADDKDQCCRRMIPGAERDLNEMHSKSANPAASNNRRNRYTCMWAHARHRPIYVIDFIFQFDTVEYMPTYYT